MDLLFHIIFIPHSVKYLQYGVLSLVKYSNYRYCLISNGLDDAEHAILEDLAASNDRISLKGVPGTKILPHGDIVNQLFKECTEDYFCLMDNDIFATAPFQKSLEENFIDCDVFSSAYTLGADPTDAGAGYMGSHLQTPGGMPLAVTHLCIYPRRKLATLIDETGVGFEHYFPMENMPNIALEENFPEDLSQVHKLDTGILMNILAGMRGWRFRFSDLNELVHIGSIAGHTKRHSKWSRKLRRLFSPRNDVYILTDKDLETEIVSRIKRRARKKGIDAINKDDEKRYVKHKVLRRRLATYFLCLFKSAVDGEIRPEINVQDAVLAQRVSRATEIIEQVINDAKH